MNLSHKNCRGSSLVLDLSQSYRIESPSIQIVDGVVMPGMLEIRHNKKSNVTLTCNQCEESFSGKNELESKVLAECNICGEKFPPSELLITPYITCLCRKCLETGATKENIGSSAGKVMALYENALSRNKDSFETLLTVLLKR